MRHEQSNDDAKFANTVIPGCASYLGADPSFVIPGRAEREPGIHPTAIIAAQWIPGSRRFASRPGMTKMICPTGKSAK
jgi:hypothetical protein